MIPAGKYDPRRASDLLWYLIQEIRRTQQDRADLENAWVRWEQVYRARPADERKNFPFDGASNLVVPVAAADVDTLYSRLMGLLFEPPSLWSVNAQRPELVDFAAATNEFLQWAQENEIKPYRDVGNWLIELHKLGTGVLKQRYTREMKKVYEWREMDQGNWQQQAVIMLKDNPNLNHVRLNDFYIPAGFPRIQQAPWVAERIRLTWMQYMNRVKAGIYSGGEQLSAWAFNPSINSIQQQFDDISHYRASVNTQMEFFEFWLDFDIDGDGWDEALVCTVHLESETYVRLDFNPFFNQEKPYSAGCFMRDVNSFYGIGLGEMLDQFQEEITAMHNQRIDNGTVTNSSMWAIRKDNTHIKVKEPIYVGKIWRLNDPSKDIVRLPMGDGGQLSSSINNEAATRQEAQRRTGVNDYVQANASPEIGYGAAYTTQQMLLSSSKRFGETLREVRDTLAESGTRILELYQQFNPRGKAFVALGQKDGMLVDVILRMPLDLIRKGLRVSVTAIDANNSKDAQIRTTTIVFQQLSQFYQNYLTMLSYVANPQMPPAMKQVAMQAAEGSSVLMRRLLELYGIQDYDRMLPELNGGVNAQQQQLANIAAVLQSASMGGGSQALGGGIGGAPTPQQGAGLLGMAQQSPALLGAGGMGGPQAGGQPGVPLPFAGGAPVGGQGVQYAR